MTERDIPFKTRFIGHMTSPEDALRILRQAEEKGQSLVIAASPGNSTTVPISEVIRKIEKAIEKVDASSP